MRFSAVHKVASYLMISAAFAALALSHELSPVILAVTTIALALSFFAEPARYAVMRHRVWNLLWNLATLLAFAVSVLEAVSGELLTAGVRFLCLLMVNKVWNRRASRDYLQAYAVSFLMLVAGAALSTDLSYALCFLAYVVFATWTLTLFHLRREMEENYLVKHSDTAQSERVEVDRILNSRRIVGARFLLGTSLVSIGVFLGSTLAFFLIPRVGFGFFVSRARKGVNTVGFSDRVELGQYGLVKDNPQVVMRVELADGLPPGGMRFRGVTFDQYKSGRWNRTTATPPVPLRRHGELSLVGAWVDPGQRIDGKLVRKRIEAARVQQIYLEPLDTPILFAAPEPIAFALGRPANPGSTTVLELEARGPAEVIAVEKHVEPTTFRTYSVERKSALRYTAYSDESLPSPSLLTRKTPVGPPPASLAPYLALPSELPARIGVLAHKITDGHESPMSKAIALERHLQTQYRYTLDLKHDVRYEPLEDFLFVQKAGHCEYFASAMAVMLRTVGIPTRTVNGFLGGEWNAYGHYLAVRQGDAHSWVEVWIDGHGWVTFDPTPVAPPGTAKRSWLDSVRQVMDTVELAWLKWVIEYDLGKQADAVSSVRRWFGAGTNTPGEGIWTRVKRHRNPIGAGLVLLAAVAAAWRWRRRARGGPSLRPLQARAQSAFERAERALLRRGWSRHPSETASELARRATEGKDSGSAAFTELVALYYAARFGAMPVDPAELDRLARQVVQPPAKSGPSAPM